MANSANVPWMASDTKRVTVMSVENISSVIRTKRRGGGGGKGKRGDKEWSGRGLKGRVIFVTRKIFSVQIHQNKKRSVKNADQIPPHCGSPDGMCSFKIISRARSTDPKILTGTTLER